jgi:Methyltransferase domain
VETALLKYDIVTALARRRGLSSLLEISTATTGFTFGTVDRGVFRTAHRLAYNTPAADDDGQEYTYRTSAAKSYELLSAIRAAPQAKPIYDVVFVDSFHTYHCSMTDLHGAWLVTRPGGVIIVHDCNPTDPNIVQPNYKEGSWCGVTYQAFIEFTLTKPSLHFYTVDADMGCGVLMKPPCLEPPTRDVRRIETLQFEWSQVRDDDEARYSYFDRHRAGLLNLISVEAFQELEMAFEIPASSG